MNIYQATRIQLSFSYGGSEIILNVTKYTKGMLCITHNSQAMRNTCAAHMLTWKRISLMLFFCEQLQK